MIKYIRCRALIKKNINFVQWVLKSLLNVNQTLTEYTKDDKLHFFKKIFKVQPTDLFVMFINLDAADFWKFAQTLRMLVRIYDS